jgi:uncharacterized protein YbaR (Trm112 family)
MPAESQPSVVFEPSILAQLACPVCQADLRIKEARLICVQCARAYPIVDGIPVLIAAMAFLS